MQNIHVQRYLHPGVGYQGTIEPEDRSWVVVVDKDGDATLWRRVQTSPLDGKVEHVYGDVELPSRTADHPLHPPSVLAPCAVDQGDNPFDFTVNPEREPKMDAIDPAGHAREDELYPDRRDGFIARLNCRSVGAWGETEHEAIRALMYYIIKLCTAGSLDHTGGPVVGNRRRYQAVFGIQADA